MDVSFLSDPAAVAAYLVTFLTAIYGLYKAAQPFMQGISRFFSQHSESVRLAIIRFDSIDTEIATLNTRLDSITLEMAPTNGDRRSVSDRLDTVKYQNKCVNGNLESIAEWLHEQFPAAAAPALNPLPDR